MTPDLSVIVPVHRGARAYLGRVVPRYREAGVELILVDDGADLTAAEFPRARILRTARPCSGPATARNLGAAQARSPWLLFADADVLPTAAAVTTLRSACAAASPREILQGTYAHSTDLDLPISRYKSLYYEFRYTRAEPAALPGLHGYLFAIHGDAFGSLGGFDGARRTATVEDDDLGRRALAAGYRIRRLEGLEGTHLKEYTLPRLLRRAFRAGRERTELLLRHRGEIADNPALLQLGLTRGAGALDLYATVPLAALLATPLAPLAVGAAALVNHRMVAFYAARGGAADAARAPVVLCLELLAAMAGGVTAGLRGPG